MVRVFLMEDTMDGWSLRGARGGCYEDDDVGSMVFTHWLRVVRCKTGGVELMEGEIY